MVPIVENPASQPVSPSWSLVDQFDASEVLVDAAKLVSPARYISFSPSEGGEDAIGCIGYIIAPASCNGAVL